jgi:putative transposase
MKYAWIASQLAAHSVRSLCRALHVSPSGFYAWRGRAPSARSRENQRLVEVIRTVHTEFRQAYGTEKLWRELRDRGESCGRHRVARLRQRHQIVTQRRCRFVTARAAYDRTPPAPRIFTWPFASPAPNRVWASDITQIPTRRGWLYLAIVLDAFSRRVVGWAMSDRMQQELASSALSMALTQRRPSTELIHHSDRGSQYTSKAYRAQLDGAGIVMSMSRPGMPYDNAMVESFFSSLKNELTHHVRFDDQNHARSHVFDYIELFYNRRRKHQSLGYRTPMEAEATAVA